MHVCVWVHAYICILYVHAHTHKHAHKFIYNPVESNHFQLLL